MKQFYAEILEADAPFFTGEIVSLRVPITDGDYGIMAGHRDMIAPIVPGVIHFETAEGEKKIASVGSGFIKFERNKALILVDALESPEEIDIERAKKSGVKYIAEPGGSVRDDAVIECCDKYGMAMAFTGIRLFHH